ncbi:MAG: ABC transporter transmembrane domain-containing protein, partial [Planctomycetota bacterium]
MPHRMAPVGGNFGRLWPYVWRQRRALIPSFGFAALVAVFWGLNLALTFPVVKVWLQGESLDGYVAAEIERAEGLRADYVAHLGRIDDRLKGGPLHGAGGEVVSTEPPDEDEQIALIADQARAERKLEAAGWDLYLMEWVQTHVLPHLPADQFDLLATIFGTLLVMTMAKGLCVFTQDVLVGGAIERVMVQLRTHAFRKTLALDQQTLAREGTANLMARFTNDVNQLAYGLQLIGGKVVREPLKALACLTGAMLVSWRLTLLSLVFAPLAALIFYKIGKAMKRASARLMDSTAAIYTTLEETFDASKVVIAYGGGPRHRRQFHQRNKDYLKTATRIVRFDAMTSPTTETLGLVAAFAALLPGAYLVLRGVDDIWGIKLATGRLDVAELSLLYGFLAGLIDPLRKLSTVYNKLKRSAAAADRIFGLIDSEPLVKQAERPAALPRLAEAVTFRSV